MEVIEIKNVGFPIDDELYTRLKIVCLKKDMTLKQFLTILIEKEVKKQEEDLQSESISKK